MKRLAILFLCLSLFGISTARADDVVVVELFTSQGCDKCPPADVLLEDLSQKPSVIALAWHVDYWDFMGWKDEMAKPEHKDRQQAYNEAMGGTGVLTPQFVVNGREQITGPKKLALYQTISTAAVADDISVHVRFDRSEGNLSVMLTGKVDERPAVIRLVWFEPMKRMEIRGGANNGKKMDYANIVKSASVIGTFAGGEKSLVIDTADPNRNEAECLAILIQTGDAGPILGAGQFCL